MSKEEKPKSLFKQLREIDITDHVEKKNNFYYLSWAWALDVMYEFDENAEFEFPEREVFADGTVMIYCDVTIKGKKKRGFLPVMDFKNNAVRNPDARKISDSMQRCLVKTIALHGLGLNLYAGEDLPDESKDQRSDTKADKKADAPNVNVKPLSGEEFLMLQNGLKNAQNFDEFKVARDKCTQALPRMNEDHLKTLKTIKNKKKTELENREMDGSHE